MKESRVNEDSLIEAGKEARAQGDIILAASLYKQALEINPDSQKAVKRLGSTLYAQSDFNAAAEVYRSAIARLEDRNEVGEVLGNLHLSLGAVFVSLNRLEEAQEQIARASQAGADKILLSQSRGNVHLALEQFDAALIDFEAYTQLDPNSLDGYLGKAKAYQGKRQHDLAAEALRNAQTLAPDNHWVEVALGNLADDVADHPSALEHYQKALLLKPDSPTVRYNLGAAYLDLEQYAAAKQMFSEVLKQCPNDAQSMAGLARAEEGLGNGRQAIALFKSAIVADPSNISYYAALSHVQVASGKVLDAVRTALRGRKVRLHKQKR